MLVCRFGGCMNRKEVFAKINEIGIVPCARVQSSKEALFAADMLYASGIPILEICLTLPQANEVIETLSNRYPDMVVGAGTVLDEGAAQRSIDAGAKFITSPGWIPEVLAYSTRANIVGFPGALTP